MASQVVQDGSKPGTPVHNLNFGSETNGTASNVTDGSVVGPESPASSPPKSAAPTDSLRPPPNGGLVAWLQVLGAFMVFFNTWGMLSAFSVFQTYYESGELFHESSSNISWIGSIQCFLLQLTGLIAGPLYDRGYLRQLLAIGSFMALLGQAFCIGIGAGLLFVPIVSLLPTYFTTHLGLAIGIASSGSSLGGVIYPIVLSELISTVGFPWAVRSVGFIVLATFAIPLVVLRVRFLFPKPRAVVDWAAFTDVPFMTFTLALAIIFIGQTVVLFYISYYPADKALTTPKLAFYIAAIFNAGSSVGRVLPNALSDRIGVFNTLAPFTMLYGMVVLWLLAVDNAAGMVVEAVVTGFFSGVVIAMPPVCFRVLTKNPSMIGTRIGQGFAIAGFGLLIGGPSAGAILGRAHPLNWVGVWLYAGITICVGGLLLFVVRVMRAGLTLKVKI